LGRRTHSPAARLRGRAGLRRVRRARPKLPRSGETESRGRGALTGRRAASRLVRSAKGGLWMAGDIGATRQIGWLALVLFVGGFLLPFAVSPLLVSRLVELPHQRAVNLSAGIAGVCELLALVLGVVGWRHPPGKVAGIGAGVLIGLVLLATVAFVLR